MTAIQSQSKRMDQEQTEQTEQKATKKEMISKILETSKKFQEDTKQSVGFEPNVPQLVLFPSDWYLEFDEMVNEQITVFHKTAVEAAEYAEKHYRIRNKLETDPNDDSRSWGSTTYRGVKLPNTTFPDLQREIRLTSKKAVTAINNKLAEASQFDDGDILLLITKKQGKTQYQTEWEVEFKAQ